MTAHYDGHQFEALKLRYEDQVHLLRTLTEIDHKLLTAFFTLQLALGAWLVSQTTLACRLQLGVGLVELAFTAVVIGLLYNNNRRRQEVAATIGNINEALGFDEPDVYLKGRPLNPLYVRRYWFPWYAGAAIISTVGVALALFR